MRASTTTIRLSRRRFMTSASATLGLLAGVSPPADATRQILMRAIPKTGERLPAIGMGTSRTFNTPPDELSQTALAEVFRRFSEAGGTLVDTSPMYGNAEAAVGALRRQLGLEDRVFLATKVWTSGKDEGIEQMRQSMRLLETDSVDLMQVHNLSDWETQLKTLNEWKEKGLVRYVGITHYRTDAFEALERLLRDEDLDFVQLNYNIAVREAENRLLPLAAERGVATLINRPFERGSLFKTTRGKELPPWAGEFDCKSWAQFFLKYILAHPAVTCPIPATSKPKHMVDNMGAGYGRLPDANARKKMVALMESL